MGSRIRLGIDLMGSDHPAQAIFEAVMEVAQHWDASITLYAIATHDSVSQLRSLVEQKTAAAIDFVTCSEAIVMEDAPLLAVRRKKDSTMATGVRLLKEGQIDAFVTAGNTGALVAMATLHLTLLPQIERPALLVTLPTAKKKMVVLDVGANVLSKPEYLLAYARLGTTYQRIIYDQPQPKIGLLNIGVEEQKGTKERIAAYGQLQTLFGADFLGNVEGRSVFEGDVDVLITDGFTGNVFLKASEGVSKFMIQYLQNHLPHDSKLSLHSLSQHFDYSHHPGAFLCGFDKIVVKCHGHSDKLALINGIEGAISLVKCQIIKKMRNQLTS